MTKEEFIKQDDSLKELVLRLTLKMSLLQEDLDSAITHLYKHRADYYESI